MATTAVERAVLDTNVLLAATDEARVEHARAMAALDDWPAAGTALYTTGQILREYLAVATRATEHNGLGLTQAAALGNVRAFRDRLRLLAEDERVHGKLTTLLDQVACTGKQVHDANVVATMLAHGVATLVTMNTGDYTRFAGHVRVIAL